MSQVLVAFGLLDFNVLRPVLAWRAFWNLWTVYLFNFLYSGRGEPRILNQWIRGHTRIWLFPPYEPNLCQISGAHGRIDATVFWDAKPELWYWRFGESFGINRQDKRVSMFLKKFAIDLPKCTASHPKLHSLRLQMFNFTLVLMQINQCLLYCFFQAKDCLNYHWVAMDICSLSYCGIVHEVIWLIMRP
jgi:hypothetical protein